VSAVAKSPGLECRSQAVGSRCNVHRVGKRRFGLHEKSLSGDRHVVGRHACHFWRLANGEPSYLGHHPTAIDHEIGGPGMARRSGLIKENLDVEQEQQA